MSRDIHAERILILDFGSQYTQLIARRVREAGVYCEIKPHDLDAQAIQAYAPKGIILSGGPETVTLEHTPRAADIVFELGCPVLGICYGMQTMASQLGGEVLTSDKHEFGHAVLDLLLNDSLLHTTVMKDQLSVWMSHGDHVVRLPEGFVALAKTDNAPFAAMANEAKQFYGLQFHPEVTHTELGGDILKQFVLKICQCQGLWQSSAIIDEAISDIQQKVGQDKVILALSGGVDSAVTAMLLQKAIGDRLVCVFVDNGFMRLNEPNEVVHLFQDKLGLNLIAVDAAEAFQQCLAGISEPEAKRKACGEQFIKVFDEKAVALGDIKWLAQGTIYPDVIESAGAETGKAHVIKTHHNVGGLPDDMTLKLIEPLRELFKDEVREIGLQLGLPPEQIFRHPFPGPGLAIRVLGEVKPEFLQILKQADAIYLEELRKHDLYDQVAQAFAVFLPVQTVGVMGDARKYDYVIALRAVVTLDFMTAKWAELPHEFLAKVSHRICNEVSGVARVVYDITGKPPATIEWE